VTLAIPTLRRFSFNAIARVGKALHSALIGLMFFAGLASITYGCWMIYKPLGPMMGGVLVVSIALWLSTQK
jgi:hypothetical protein